MLRGIMAAFGRDLYVQPARDIAKSAEVDSTFVVGVVELADNALASRMPAHLEAAATALRQIANRPAGRHPSVLLARGRIERIHGLADSAIAAFGRLVRIEPDNSTAWLELARTRLASGRMAGVDNWYRGLAVADSASLAMYRFDLSLVMSDSALQTFDSARTPAARVAVARRFWAASDPEGLNSAGERLREHYRRISYAERNFGLLPPGHRFDSVTPYPRTGSLFDDRGLIYVRHGEPDDQAGLSMIGIPPNTTWLYHRADGDLLFHFAQPDSAEGYRMYPSLLDILGLGVAAQSTGQGDVARRLAHDTAVNTYGAEWTARAAKELLASRENLSPVYYRMLAEGRRGAQKMQQRERARGLQDMATGLNTESWRFGYELPLKATVKVVAVGSSASGPQLQVAFAIPGSSLYAPPSPGSVVYPIRTRVSIRAADGTPVLTVDTMRRFVAPGPIAETGDLLARLPVTIAPGDYQVRVAVETPSRGVVTPPMAVHVAALNAPDHLTLTDIALGTRSVPLAWVTGRDTAWINPINRFSIDAQMHLYFEVGGAKPGQRYTVQLAVTRHGHDAPDLQLAFQVRASGSPDPVHRNLSIRQLHTGDYLLRVTVTDSGGGRAIRERAFTVTH